MARVTAASEVRSRPLLVAAAVLAYALVAAVCRPLTLPALVAVLLPGVVLSWFAVRRRPERPEQVGSGGAAVWLLLGLGASLAELALFVWGNDAAHPTLSMLGDPLFATYPGRVAGYALWLGAGAWLASR